MSRRGRVITLAGGVRAGKSIQTPRLAEPLRGQGASVLVAREPGGSSPAAKRQKLSPAESA